MGQYVAGGVPQISQNPQVTVAIGTTELQRFARVVRNREGCDLDFTQVNAGAVLCPTQQALKVALANPYVGAMAHPDWGSVAQRQLACATDVVAVFVGYKNGVNLVKHKASPRKAVSEYADSKTTVNQQTFDLRAAAAFDHSCVASAAATQAPEP